jgi:tetratricopeptide (TPR) repeat protein
VAQVRSLKQFCMSRNRNVVMGIFACGAVCAVWAQTGEKQKEPSTPFAVSGEAPAQAALAAHEAELRHDLELHPKSASTLYKLGLVLRQENKPKESLEIYTQAAQQQKPDAEQLRSVALDYVLLNDYPDAIHWLETALSIDPKNVEVLYSLGRCFYTQGDYRKAEVLYLRVLQIKPDHLKAEENLGLAYDAENRPENAEETLRAAAALASQQASDEWPSLNFGSVLLDHDRAAEAVPYLQKAVTIAPKSAICHEKLGRALEQSGKALDGVRELEMAVQLDPKSSSIHFELGHAYRQVGNVFKARAEFAVSEELIHERDQK